MKATQTIVVWACVAGTLAMIAGGVWFYLQFNKYAPVIKGKVVVLENIDKPADPRSVASINDWMKKYSAAFPGCRCALGKSRLPEENGVLLYCVGFSGGAEKCSVVADKLPKGAAVFEAPFSEAKQTVKAAFLFEHITGTEIISPATSREMIKPSQKTGQ